LNSGGSEEETKLKKKKMMKKKNDDWQSALEVCWRLHKVQWPLSGPKKLGVVAKEFMVPKSQTARAFPPYA
jgi:hypothetical protein